MTTEKTGKSKNREPMTLTAEGERDYPAQVRHRKIDLHNLTTIRFELCRVYRAVRNKEIEAGDGSRLTFILGELVKLHTVMDMEARLNRLENLKAGGDDGDA